MATVTTITTPSLLGRLVGGAVTAVRLPGQAVETGRRLVADATDVAEQAAALAVRAVRLVERIEVLVDEIAGIAARADLVASKADTVATEIGEVSALAETQVQRLQALLDACAPALLHLQPVLDQAGVVLAPRHSEAVARLLDLTPEVIDLISPALTNLGDLTPELHALAERFEAMGQIVEGIPGSKRLKRRGAAEEEPPG